MTILEFMDKHIVGVGAFAFSALVIVGFIAFLAVLAWGEKPVIRK